MRKIFICLACVFFITTSSFAAFRSYGPTDSCDNLWQLASRVRPQGVSVQQVMLVLFCVNKCAFYCDNINALAEGEILKVPSSADFIKAAAKVSKEQAYSEVEVQNREWRSIHSTPYVKHSKYKHLSKRLKKKIKNKKIKSNKNKVEPLVVAEPKEEKTEPKEENIQENTQGNTQSEQSEMYQSVINQSEVDQLVSQSENQEIPPSPPPQATQETPVVDERLATIESKNDAIQNQVSQINDRINSVEQGVDQIKNNLDKKNDSSVNSKSIWQRLAAINPYLGKPGVLIGIAGFVVFLFILFIRRRRRSVNYSQKVLAKKEEYYNPMEDTSSKLNLARAYIDMGKDADAKTILDEIVASGNESEQAEAKKILEKIK
jgi:FimV-like protein